MDPLDALNKAAEAGFATDERGRILAWNRAASELLGHQASQVIGRRCYEVVAGTDVFGNRFCSKECPLRQMVCRGEPIKIFEIGACNASGAMVKARCSVVIAGDPRSGEYTLAHFFQPTNIYRRSEVNLNQHLESIAALDTPFSSLGSQSPSEGTKPLTDRETQVLRLLAVGASTEEIARTLSISRVTVRNHIQHILPKLLQAIRIALHRNLI
jgi:DNA-binding CsgD family transcriptional regulator